MFPDDQSGETLCGRRLDTGPGRIDGHQKRIAEQRNRHVVQYRRRYVEVSIADEQGMTFEAIGGTRNDVERYNEQISLLCNIEGARLLSTAEALAHVQPVFRAHPSPPLRRIEALEGLIAELAARHQLPDGFHWNREEEPLADYLPRLATLSDGDDKLERIASAIVPVSPRSTRGHRLRCVRCGRFRGRAASRTTSRSWISRTT